MQLPWQTIYNFVSTDNSKLLSSIILHLWKEILSLSIFTSVCYSWTMQIFPSLKTEKWYLFVTLICIFPNSSETEHFFMCSLAICVSLWTAFSYLFSIFLLVVFLYFLICSFKSLFWILILVNFLHSEYLLPDCHSLFIFIVSFATRHF